MANPQQREILRSGATAWNNWRKENPDSKVDLQGGSFKENNLAGVNLRLSNLWRSDFRRTNLQSAILSESDLSEADFWEANLVDADLSNTNMSYTNLIGSDLEGVNLHATNLAGTNLTSANLFRASLDEASLNGANLGKANLNSINLRHANLRAVNFYEADLSNAKIGDAIFAGIDFSETRGLEEVQHEYPSTVGTDTLQLSKGKIPEAFLRGCGLSDVDIEYAKLANPDLSNEEIVKIQYRIYDIRATQAIQISPLFISYSHGDSTFVDRLEKDLNKKGVRFWRDIHDMTAGRMEAQIDRAIRQNPTVLLILSKNSMNSDWVQHEVRKARELEKELGRDTLCPIALDDGWKSSRWPQRVMEQVMEYNILDFSKWEEETTFQIKFAKLLSGLHLFYKKPEK